MIIGKFTQQDDGYTGDIFGIGLECEQVTFAPAPAKVGNGPDFVVLATAEQYEIGAGWAKTSKAGKPYLSVKLDGPTLVQPINCALTTQQDGSYALVWSRREVMKADEMPVDAETAAA